MREMAKLFASRHINDFFQDWDNSHNNKNIGLFDKLYSESVNYYNSKNYSKFQILDDKIRILKKYPEFKQSSKIVSKEEISNQLIKVNYEKSTFYNDKNRIFNSYLILDTSNNQLKIYEENDNKNSQTKINNLENNIKNTNLANEEEKISSKDLNLSDNQTKNIENRDNWKSKYIDFYELRTIKSNAEEYPSKLEDWENLYKNHKISISSWLERKFNDPVEIKAWLDTNLFKSNYSNENAHDINRLKEVGINTPDKLKEWSIVSKEVYRIIEYKEKNISIEEAIKWEKFNFRDHYSLKSYTELNVKPDEIKDLKPGILPISKVLILRDLNMKLTPLIESIFYKTNIHDKEQFIKLHNALINNNCKIIEKSDFSYSDEYDNEGLCYPFTGKLIQRLNKNEGIMSPFSYGNGTNSHIYFEGSWAEKSTVSGVVKGMGNVSYTTIMNSKNLIRSGKVLFFK